MCGTASTSARRGVPLDIDYLETLGPSSIEALMWFEGQDIISGRQHEAAQARRRITRGLQCALTDWRQWTFLNHRIWRAANPGADPVWLSMCAPNFYLSSAPRKMESAP